MDSQHKPRALCLPAYVGIHQIATLWNLRAVCHVDGKLQLFSPRLLKRFISRSCCPPRCTRMSEKAPVDLNLVFSFAQARIASFSISNPDFHSAPAILNRLRHCASRITISQFDLDTCTKSVPTEGTGAFPTTVNPIP